MRGLPAARYANTHHQRTAARVPQRLHEPRYTARPSRGSPPSARVPAPAGYAFPHGGRVGVVSGSQTGPRDGLAQVRHARRRPERAAGGLTLSRCGAARQRHGASAQGDSLERRGPRQGRNACGKGGRVSRMRGRLRRTPPATRRLFMSVTVSVNRASRYPQDRCARRTRSCALTSRLHLFNARRTVPTVAGRVVRPSPLLESGGHAVQFNTFYCTDRLPICEIRGVGESELRSL